MSDQPDFPDEAMPQVRDDLATSDIDGELVVLDEQNGNVHQLNRTATVVFECCDGSTRISDIRQRLVDEFDVSPDVARHDVLSLLRLLREQHLLTG